jgi:glucosamine-6-phosphate deaminase
MKNQNKFHLQVLVASDETEFDLTAAKIVAEQLTQKPNSKFIFPTGSTPLGMYKHLVAFFDNKELNFSQAQVFNLDEYYPIKRDTPASYFHYMKENLVDKINILPENWHIPNGEAPEPLAEAQRYEAEIKGSGSFDLAVLGIGPGTTCHIGFNEPPSAINTHVRYVTLTSQTISANSVNFKEVGQMPSGALTMGIADIFRAEKILLLAKGKVKSVGVDLTLAGAVNEEAPASFLRLHPNVTFLLDPEAAEVWLKRQG